MKKLTGLLICVLAATSLLGQSSRMRVKEISGDMAKVRGWAIMDVFEMPSKNGYWALATGPESGGLDWALLKKQALFVQRYDENMNLINEKLLDLKYDGRTLRFEKVLRFQKEFYFFLSFYNKEKKKKYLFFTKFDHIDLTLEEGLKKVAEVKHEYSRYYSSSYFDIAVSDNEKNLVVFGHSSRRYKRQKVKYLFIIPGYRSTYELSDKNTAFSYWVLDKKMEIVNYSKKHTIEEDGEKTRYHLRSFRVGDDGSLYTLSKHTKVNTISRKEKRKKKKATGVEIKQAKYLLEKIDPFGNVSQYVTEEEDLFVDMDILFDADGNINLLGLNGIQVYNKLATSGVSRIILSSDGLEEMDVVSENLSEKVLENVNDIEVYEENLSKRKKKRLKKKQTKQTVDEKKHYEASKKAALNANFIAYSGIDENGDAILVLEERHIRVVTYTTTDANGHTTTRTVTYYHYDDLILLKFYEGEVAQNFYKKSFMTVDVPLARSIDVALGDGEMSIMTQGHIVKCDYDLETVRDYELQAFKRKGQGRGRDKLRKGGFTFRKAVNKNTILAPKQHGRKIKWYKIEVQ